MAKFTRQPRRNESMIAGMYDLEERLGSGHFAEVKLARHVFTGERVAVKVIDKLKLDETAKHHLYQEVRCMKLVQHPNIVRLYEVIDTNTKLYLVQELGDGGDMYDYIMKHESGLSEEKARRYFRQILQAIDYCHRLFVVHRDLKPENVIFFKKYDVAKLTDFGFSNKFLPGTKLQTACGSLAYSAPEILLGDSYDAPAVDVWSLGVILYMMVVGKAPFYEANESETLTMILDCKFIIPDHVSPACQRLISQMIVRDACKRATLEDILGDPWVQGDHGPVAVTSIPLANQVKIGVDHHNEIVEKMQLGDIADHDTINKCLESGSYNHISATYYLLAEQILRRLRWHRNVSSSSISSCGQDEEVKSHVLKRQSLPPQKTKNCSSDEEQNLSVPVIEELPLSDGNEVEEPEDIDMNLKTSKIRYHSTESIYDEIKNNDKQHNQDEIVGAVSVAVTKNQRKTFQKKRVAKVKSTPAFLNQISEERESDLDDSPRASPRVRRSSRRPLNVIQKTRRPSPASSTASSTGGRRSSSHSSSSEDDNDLDKKMRRLSTERCRKSPKRRSDDEGDGDDGGGGTQEPHGVARKKMMSEKPQQSGSNEDTTSQSGGTSNKQGKSTQLGLHSEILQEKLLNIPAVKVDEHQNSNCEGISSMDMVTCNETCLSENLTDYSKDVNTISCSEYSKNHQELKVKFTISGECEGGMDVRVEKDINSENIKECCQGIEHTSVNNLEIQAGSMLIDSENISMRSDDCMSNPDNRTKDVQNFVKTSQNFEEISKGNAVELVSAKNNVQNEKSIVDVDKVENETVDISLKCETIRSELNVVNEGGRKCNNDVLARNDECNGMIEIIKERSLTNESLEGISDKENVDISEKENYINGDSKRLRGSDIEEIEMYMKNRETTLEMQSGAVRTIYNNPKISRVTSNCCHIV